jgi:hypothetical protein
MKFFSYTNVLELPAAGWQERRVSMRIYVAAQDEKHCYETHIVYVLGNTQSQHSFEQ